MSVFLRTAFILVSILLGLNSSWSDGFPKAEKAVQKFNIAIKEKDKSQIWEGLRDLVGRAEYAEELDYGARVAATSETRQEIPGVEVSLRTRVNLELKKLFSSQDESLLQAVTRQLLIFRLER